MDLAYLESVGTTSWPSPATKITRNTQYADYASCNGARQGGTQQMYNYSCICDNFIDRVIAHQDVALLKKLGCSEGMTGGGACNCSAISLDASSWWTGLMPISLPWTFKANAVPATDLTRFGSWFSHPGASKCADGAASLPVQPPVAPGAAPANSGPCNWRRLAAARIVYGADLLAHGWNRTGGHSVNCTNDEMESNLAAFTASFAALPMRPRVCGE